MSETISQSEGRMTNSRLCELVVEAQKQLDIKKAMLAQAQADLRHAEAARLKQLVDLEPFHPPPDLVDQETFLRRLNNAVVARCSSSMRTLTHEDSVSWKFTSNLKPTLLAHAARRKSSNDEARDRADQAFRRRDGLWQLRYNEELQRLESLWIQMSQSVQVELDQCIEKQHALRAAHEDDLRRRAVTEAHANSPQDFARQDIARAEQTLADARDAVCSRFDSQLQSGFLVADIDQFASANDATLTQRLVERQRAFLRSWCRAQVHARLDDQQLAAMASVRLHTLVTARAGSGKTRTLVSRAAFLSGHCGISMSHLLLLAFNKKAAEEMRLSTARAGTPCPHVMTFHALAYALVHPKEALTKGDPGDEDKEQSAVMQAVVNDFLQDPKREAEVRDVLYRHFRADWDHIVSSGMAMTRDEGLTLRRSLQREALDGTRVKSFGEKVIANFLVEHNIRYRYEKNHWWGQRNYRPDFTLTGKKVVIEYFGRIGEPEYDRECEEKRQYWKKKKGWTLLEYSPPQVADGGGVKLSTKLAQDLERLGVLVVRLSEEEIWSRVQSRFRTRFAEVATDFVGRCRKALITPDNLESRLREHAYINDVERDVLAIMADVYRAYLERLANECKEDFDGLLKKAADLVAEGTTKFARSSGAGDLADIRYVMVDEYQDFSPLFNLLLHAVRARNPSIQVFCVGDDWQSINGFAGSDLRFFRGFSQHFAGSVEHAITTNYRSVASVVEVGNRIMAGKGKPAVARVGADRGEVLFGDLATFIPSVSEAHHWHDDTVTPAVRRLLVAPLKAGQSIAVLARQRYLPYDVCRPADGEWPKEDLARLRGLITAGLIESEREQIYVGTAHAYKGREADVVIVLDAVDRRFPKIHPDWVFGRIFGNTPAALIEEERRLFYVACSRAISKLVVLTEKGRESPFLEQIWGNTTKLDWDTLQPFCPSDGDWIILVGNASGTDGVATKARADVLNERGYRYHGGEWPHWRNRVSRNHSLAWILENLPRAPWLPGPDGLDIRICKSDGAVAARQVLEGGRLQTE